jgi:hypothetical protein
MLRKEYFDLDKMIERAFEEEDVAKILKEGIIDKNSIKEEITIKYPEILKTFSEDIARIESYKADKDAVEKNIYIGSPFKLISNIFIFIATIIFIAIIYINFFYSFSTQIDLKNLQFNGIIYNKTIINLVLLLFLLTFTLFIYQRFKIQDSTYKLERIEDIVSSIENIVDKIYVNKILPEVKLLINKQLSPSYKTIFTLLSKNIEMKGYFDPKYEIPTESKEKLNRFLNRMSNGSIGIAGPRGAGKSTLVSSFCIKWIDKFKDKEVLSVLTSAPVSYDPRDFLLHIFSLVCNQVIFLNRNNKQNDIKLSYNSEKFNLFNEEFLIRSLVGIVLLSISLFLFLKSNILINFNELILKINNTYFYLISSIIFFYATIFAFFSPILKKKIYSLFKITTNVEETEDEIIREAKKNLQIIKFQRSFSSGWSSELSFPIGVKGGINSASTLAQNQLTLPEIVTAYRDFIGLISTKYKIIIGIDELDKISSNDKAYIFLNEIKGIFNLKDCYYLISVSEDAMINFNKRGMPFRDAFDSSFDDIIYINYLSFESSKELIKRRIIGMPVPFMCLCYLMSGGLARDLIRVCRDLIDCYELNPKKDKLCFLSKYLIKKDIMLKINAIKMDSKDIDLDDHNPTEELIEDIYNLEKSLEDDSSLWICCLNILSYSKKSSISNNSNKYEHNESYRSNFFRAQIGVYLYYVLTIMEFFEREIEESDFKKYEDSRSFDELIRAHHFLGLYPKMAEKIVTSFRNEQGMRNIQLTQNELTKTDVT